MDLFWKAATGILIAVILSFSLEKWEKSVALLLTVTVCCMVSIIAASFLRPVLDLIKEIETLGGLKQSNLNILLKIIGIGFLSEIVCMICFDSGNSSLGKIIIFLSSCVTLWLAIPIVKQFLDLLKQIMGAI